MRSRAAVGQRWRARLMRSTRDARVRAHLHADAAAVAPASVEVRGDVASIELPWALMHGHSRFRWTENC
jgi:hypothetical protein